MEERPKISKKDSVKTQASTIESCACPNSEVESHSDLQEELKTLFDSSKDSAENEEEELSKCFITQCAEMILSKIEKTFNKAYTGLKSFFRRFQIFFS